ncbi:N-acetylglucosamine kinase [Gloeothece verrucosa]|uniref:ATPase BadF/BadG/BcrA/BcrD type n=1 Tax=Gloeothece verrucosa (strain PCC 7822) TaxID=497965 RepID=E0UI52_GLOV7|nr:BadF/BadG/BcrA/BcrD ATPase family protein [Gloeothece verrucosa]ADN15704.1 ATPase BadF/BadG/BcrA/BcrD type [Gloeothece verrucosa PCC 7822]
MNYVLGIDGGGSKTLCILMDENREIRGRGYGGCSNYHLVGEQKAFLAMETALEKATENLNKIEIKALGIGLAGVSRPQDFQVIQNWVKELQSSEKLPIKWSLLSGNIVISHDALIALVGGAAKAIGILVNAGTGSIIFGRNKRGEVKRVGGWGHLLGDEGSAYTIAIRGMKAALKGFDGSGEKTLLSAYFQQHLSLASLEDLVKTIYQKEWGVSEIASLAPLIDQVAVAGDLAAQKILEQTVNELVEGTKIVKKTLFSESEIIEIVTSGSVWQSQYPIRARFQALLEQHSPQIRVIQPRHEPAYGAALLALQTFNPLA